MIDLSRFFVLLF